MQVLLTIIRFILGFIGVILAVFTILGTIGSFEAGLSGDEVSAIIAVVILTLLTLGSSIMLGVIEDTSQARNYYKIQNETLEAALQAEKKDRKEKENLIKIIHNVKDKIR